MRKPRQSAFALRMFALFVLIGTQPVVGQERLPIPGSAPRLLPPVGTTSVQESLLLDLRQIRQVNYFETIQPDEGAESEGESYGTPGPAFDPAMVSQGEAAFYRACLDCHDAARALSKAKSLPAWRATVSRMAAKEGAEIPAADVEPIAVYLASLNPEATAGGDAWDARRTGSNALTLFATVSPVYREGDNITSIENPGFFPDAWLGAEWRPSGPLAGRVGACTSCHNTRQGLEMELAEALIELDVVEAIWGQEAAECSRIQSRVVAGRMIVPFGAFAATAHPGANRAVTNPLMFNMGRRVFGNVGPPRQPVLPMPYADEGVNLKLGADLFHDVSATIDLYTVNGLQEAGTAPQIGATSVFFTSRSYSDNNSKLAFGGRATVGNSFIRFGGSAMSGELQDDGSPRQHYWITGVDVQARYEDLIRFTFEYAARREEDPGSDDNFVYGMVASGELQVLNCPQIFLFTRYDTLEYRDNLGADEGLDRITWGLNIPLSGGSLLSINHEHWTFPEPQENVEVVGARWTTAF